MVWAMSSFSLEVDTTVEYYVFIAFLVLMVYDHVLTFDNELSFV